MVTSTSASSGVGRIVEAVSGAAKGVAGSVGEVATKVGVRAGGHRDGAAHPQTLTFAAPPEVVLAAWRDADVLRRLLGDLGSVEQVEQAEPAGLLEQRRYRWTFGSGDTQRPWTSVVLERDGGLRHEGFTGDGPPDSEASSVDVGVRAAPQQLGTEVRLVLDLPLPGLAAGAAAFTVLYRLRALLDSGEIPTLGPQPAARSAVR